MPAAPSPFHPRRNALARRQDGVLTTEQLLGELDLAPSTLKRWVRERQLRRWHRGVYSDATVPEEWRRWLMAGLLRLGPQAAVAGRAAAALWGLAGFEGLEIQEFVLPRAKTPTMSGARVIGVKDLPASDVVRLGDLRVTSVTSATVAGTAATMPTFVPDRLFPASIE